ncbi:MAG: PilZ domain-containing protein [Candidatus Omnitrophica bacterium]|nr:PilZ domain-containing protein [Candidatus Omnitrophota bacterium]
MQERRRYVRLNIALEVSYTIQGREGAQHKAVTKNISPNGARFVVGEELPKGTVIDLKIKILTRTESIPVKAKVIWTKKETEQGEAAYDAGLEFIQISEESKDVFFQYLCNLMYDQLKKFE